LYILKWEESEEQLVYGTRFVRPTNSANQSVSPSKAKNKQRVSSVAVQR